MGLPGVRHVFIDFDSTLVTVEGLDVLATVIGSSRPPDERDDLESRVRDLTQRAMAGDVSFQEALATRLGWLRPRKADIDRARTIVSAALEPTALDTVSALGAAGLEVHVLSGGVRDLVLPASLAAGIEAGRVHCNDLRFVDDEAPGVDIANPLAHDDGKAAVVRSLAKPEEAVIVGDGATDLEVRDRGAARWFVAHVGIANRPAIAAHADHVIHRLAELVPLLT